MSVLTNDWEEYQQGDYYLVNNVWGKGSLVNGTDYTQTITIDNPDDVTSGIHMAWNYWNVDPNNHSVLAYPEISVGYKPWDAPGHGTASLSAKIRDIKTFDLTNDLTISGDTGRFNVSYDFWLTNKPLGDEYSITTELMVWTHTGGPVDNSTQPIGFYTLGETTFKIIKYEGFGDFDHSGGPTWRYIALVPDKDILNATIDMKDVFHDLIDLGVLSDSDYVTGYELGAEVTGGAGSLTINHISYDLDTYDADAQANVLVGTAGRDRIYGLGGNDTIRGNAGDDHLLGGWGHDTLTGNKGKDVFHFNQLSWSSDVISDFVTDIDRISLDGPVFGALGAGPLSQDEFKTGKAFDADTRILYRRGSGELHYDADGSASGDRAHLIATLENHAKLKYSDFDVL